MSRCPNCRRPVDQTDRVCDFCDEPLNQRRTVQETSKPQRARKQSARDQGSLTEKNIATGKPASQHNRNSGQKDGHSGQRTRGTVTNRSGQTTSKHGNQQKQSGKAQSQPEQNKPKYEGRTLKNAVIGGVVSTVAYFVPVLNVIAPIFGGGVAGYLQHQGAGGGMKAGGLKGLIMVVPAIGLGIVASGLLAQIPVIGGYLAGSVILVAIVIVGHSVALGLFGGLFGGLISGGPSSQSH